MIAGGFMHYSLTFRFHQDLIPMLRLLLVCAGLVIVSIIVLYLIDVIISLVGKNKKKRFAKSCYANLKNSYHTLMTAKEMYKNAETLTDSMEKLKKKSEIIDLYNKSLRVLRNSSNYQYSFLLSKECQVEVKKFKESSNYSLT